MRTCYTQFLLAVPFLSFNAMAQSNLTTSIPTSTTSTSATKSSSLSLLPVPTYAMANPSGTTTYSNATASQMAKSLPGYTYNLTMENLATRIGICNQTTQYCEISACDKPLANVSTNFCNPTTMGWNCACNDGANSRLSPLTVPVNSYDCKFRASACLTACQNPAATPPITDMTACQNACNYDIGETCGTSAQIVPQYKVNDVNDKPAYYPDTSKGGVALGITTNAGYASAPYNSIRIAMALLAAYGVIL